MFLNFNDKGEFITEDILNKIETIANDTSSIFLLKKKIWTNL